MNKLIPRGHAGRTALAALVLAAHATAFADPVALGSTYTVYLEGGSSGQASIFKATFDGNKQWFARGGRDLSIEESQTDLGGGSWRIDVRVWTNINLFPVLGETALVGLATDGDGFDITGDFHLQDFHYTYADTAGGSFTTRNLADDFRGDYPDPWNGWTGSFFNGNTGGRNVQTIDFSWTLTPAAVPEPGVLSLMGLGLALMAWQRRPRR